MYALPAEEDLAKQVGVPLGVVVDPLAVAPDTPVPVVDTRPFGGPIRCSQCGAAINPGILWLDGGRSFACNFCSANNPVPREYFANLDASGTRCDIEDRPELRCGSVDLIVTKEFALRPPQAPDIVFLIESSPASAEFGIISTICSALESLVDLAPTSDSLAPARIALISIIGSVIYYYKLRSIDGEPEVTVKVLSVSAKFPKDVFAPLPNVCAFASLVDDAEAIQALADQLPELFKTAGALSSPLTSPKLDLMLGLEAARSLLSPRGGRILAFFTSRPSAGPGGLEDRLPSGRGPEADQAIAASLAPASDFYVKTAADLVRSHISVDLFIVPRSGVDLPTLTALPRLTGGSLHYLLHFHPKLDAARTRRQIVATLLAPFGYEGVLRVRVSEGLQVDSYSGHVLPQSPQVILAGVRGNSALGVNISYATAQLPASEPAYVQASMLYTSADGIRYLRIHTLRLATTLDPSDVYRGMDVETIISLLSRSAAAGMIHGRGELTAHRRRLSGRVIDILAGYRLLIATSVPPSKFLLPDTLKLLPIYALMALKSPAFARAPVLPDVRAAHYTTILSSSVHTLLAYLYPTLIRLDTGIDDRLPLTARALVPDGIFALASPHVLWVWVGSAVLPDILSQLFDVSSTGAIVPADNLPVLDTSLSAFARGTLDSLRSHYESSSGLSPQFRVICEGDPSQVRFMGMLREDAQSPDSTGNRAAPGSVSYSDYMRLVHTGIGKRVTAATQASSSSSSSK